MTDPICAHHQLARQCPICEERAAREQAESAFAECRSSLFEECGKTVQAERLLRAARSATIEECRAWLVAHYYSTLAGQMVEALAARRGGEKGGGT